jgi:hypothetical protein
VTDGGSTKTISIPGAVGGTAWINGANTGATSIDAGWNLSISTMQYSQFNRGTKFLVTVLMPANGYSESFEIIANVSGNLSANSETVSYTRYGRIGHRMNGSIDVTLNKTTKTLSLMYQNNEAFNIEVNCTRIQHS